MRHNYHHLSNNCSTTYFTVRPTPAGQQLSLTIISCVQEVAVIRMHCMLRFFKAKQQQQCQ